MDVVILEMEGFTWDAGRDGEERAGEGPAKAKSVGTHHKGTCYFAW